MGKITGLNKVIKINRGLSELQKFWIYLNYVEDENSRIGEVHEIIKALNWRLRPETAVKIQEDENMRTGRNKNKQQQTAEEHINIIEKMFEGE